MRASVATGVTGGPRSQSEVGSGQVAEDEQLVCCHRLAVVHAAKAIRSRRFSALLFLHARPGPAVIEHQQPPLGQWTPRVATAHESDCDCAERVRKLLSAAPPETTYRDASALAVADELAVTPVKWWLSDCAGRVPRRRGCGEMVRRYQVPEARDYGFKAQGVRLQTAFSEDGFAFEVYPEKQRQRSDLRALIVVGTKPAEVYDRLR